MNPGIHGFTRPPAPDWLKLQQRAHGLKVFTASGAYIPTVGMKYCRVTATNGGTGGYSDRGQGGQSGATSIKTLLAADIGASQVVTVGAGGAPGVTGTNGGVGAVPGTVGGTSSLGALVVGGTVGDIIIDAQPGDESSSNHHGAGGESFMGSYGRGGKGTMNNPESGTGGTNGIVLIEEFF